MRALRLKIRQNNVELMQWSQLFNTRVSNLSSLLSKQHFYSNEHCAWKSGRNVSAVSRFEPRAAGSEAKMLCVFNVPRFEVKANVSTSGFSLFFLLCRNSKQANAWMGPGVQAWYLWYPVSSESWGAVGLIKSEYSALIHWLMKPQWGSADILDVLESQLR